MFRFSTLKVVLDSKLSLVFILKTKEIKSPVFFKLSGKQEILCKPALNQKSLVKLIIYIYRFLTTIRLLK